MTRIDLRKQTGVLEQAIVYRTEQALACGALQPITTAQTVIKQGGVAFLVRSVSSLVRKHLPPKPTEKHGRQDYNPFLPPDPELMVADISDSHLAVLNKFNVIDWHLLIVTRRFEDQENLLNRKDFSAAWRCLQELDGLAFYNGGREAGASQKHKHLQFVPLPLVPGRLGTPIDVFRSTETRSGEPVRLPALPFAHWFLIFPDGLAEDWETAATYSLSAYRQMLSRQGMKPLAEGGYERQSMPYNLLFTRRWMMLVPRSFETVEGISVNALGFVGSLFVRNQAEMETVRRLGPMELLKSVTPDVTLFSDIG